MPYYQDRFGAYFQRKNKGGKAYPERSKKQDARDVKYENVVMPNGHECMQLKKAGE